MLSAAYQRKAAHPCWGSLPPGNTTQEVLNSQKSGTAFEMCILPKLPAEAAVPLIRQLATLPFRSSPAAAFKNRLDCWINTMAISASASLWMWAWNHHLLFSCSCGYIQMVPLLNQFWTSSENSREAKEKDEVAKGEDTTQEFSHHSRKVTHTTQAFLARNGVSSQWGWWAPFQILAHMLILRYTPSFRLCPGFSAAESQVSDLQKYII